jgi:hypothetical protein
MVIIANPSVAGTILQANMPASSTPGLDGIEVKIEDLENLVGHLRIVKKRPTILSMSDGSEATENCIDLVPVRLSVWALKCLACLWLTKEISTDSLLALTTEGLIDPKSGELETDIQRARHIRDIDDGLADLLHLGMVSVERLQQDGLDHIMPGGSVEKTIKVILDKREVVRRDMAGEKARLVHRLHHLGGIPETAPAAKPGKKSAKASEEV